MYQIYICLGKTGGCCCRTTLALFMIIKMTGWVAMVVITFGCIFFKLQKLWKSSCFAREWFRYIFRCLQIMLVRHKFDIFHSVCRKYVRKWKLIKENVRTEKSRRYLRDLLLKMSLWKSKAFVIVEGGVQNTYYDILH